MLLNETVIEHCPYCGERIELIVDCSVTEQEYVEDCSVCCQPMICTITVDGDGQPHTAVIRENE